MVLLSHFIFIACVSFTIINKITRTETTNRNILGFTSFFASLRHRKKLRPEQQCKTLQSHCSIGIQMKQNKQQRQCSSDFNYLNQETNVRIDLGVGQKENIIQYSSILKMNVSCCSRYCFIQQQSHLLIVWVIFVDFS